MRENSARPAPEPEPVVEDGGAIIKVLMIAPPVVGIGVLALLLLLLVPRTPAEVSIIGDVFVICFVLCPAFLCLLPIYFILVLAAIYTGKLNSITGSKLSAVESMTEKAADSANKVGKKVGRWSIDWRTRFALLNYLARKQADSDSQT
jgi:hypothetical protein